MTRHSARILLACALLAAASGCDGALRTTDARAAQVLCDGVEVPALTGRVVDTANALSETAENSMTQSLARYERETGHQAVVLTLATLGGAEEQVVGRCIANSWGIGHAERDDGIVMLAALDDRKARVAIGAGLEADGGDAKAQQMIDAMVPHFGRSDPDAAFQAGIATMAEVFP